jgi:hypothetical protein
VSRYAFNAQGRVARVLRLAAFLAVVVAISAWWKVRQVSAELSERAMSIGRTMESWRDPAAGTSTLRVNGQRVSITSVSSDDQVSAILDRFAAMCGRHSGGMREEIHELIAHGAAIPEHVASQFGVLRAQDGELQGTAACFARESAGGMAEFLERAAKLVETGDLAAMGQLRYVFAHRRAGSTTTHVLTAINHDSLPIEQVFPASGDVPGPDLVPGVRPEHARRVVSADLEGSSARAVLYETRGKADVALQAYDAALPARGYERGDLSLVADQLPAPTRVYVKPNETLLIIAHDRDSDISQVSAFRLANGGFVPAQM